MTSTEVISQQQGKRTGYTNSFLLQNDVVVWTESKAFSNSIAFISHVEKMG